MEMSESGRSFRFIWKLKNYSFLWHREHQYLKWTFNIKRNTITSWSLLLYPSTPKNCVSCILRKESGVHLNFLVDYELSFLGDDGSPLHSIKISRADFNHKSKSVQLWLHHDEVLKIKEAKDTLSVCCRIWTAETPILEMVKYFAETEIQVQRCTLTWYIFAFSDLKPGKNRTEIVKTLSGNPCMYFSIFLDEWNRLVLQIFVLDPKYVELCKCQVFLVNASGKKLKCGRFELVTIGKTTDPDWKFNLSLTKRILMETKELYLPNDTLTLQCEVSFATGIEAEPVQKLESDCHNTQNAPSNGKIEKISKSLKMHSESPPASNNDMQSSNNTVSLNGKFEYCAAEAVFATGIKEPIQSLECDSQNIQNISCDAESANISKSLKKRSEPLSATKFSNNSSSLKGELMSLEPTENNSYTTSSESYSVPNSLLSWKDDLLILYENGTFCDAELSVTTVSFPVHSLILSIRSSVFCDHLTRAKSDGKRTSIPIKYLDADTVKKMILFLYTDTLEDLEWNSAKSLYLASNMYKILPLKDISSSFLKENLNTSNCCDILFLADKYKDNDLKKALQNFTAEHDEIINSDQWKSLEKNHPRLIIETFRFMHQKYRKN